MNDASSAEDAGLDRDQMMSALFAQMVIQQTDLAMMLLGKVPHPQTGQTTQDLEGARLFIDQLEMLEAKTKGNLSKDEERLLHQCLMSVQMAFVEVVESAGKTPAAPGKPDEPSPAAPREETAAAAPAAPPAGETKSAPEPEPESRKKFSRKY